MRNIRHLFLLILMICQLTGIYTLVSAESCIYPELTAEAAVLMDAKTGQVLFEKNFKEKQYPASITKVMTGMLALKKGTLTDILTMSNEAVFSIGRNSSHIALDVDEELTLEQALYAISISSANDASNGIAEYISGSLESFAQLMNKTAVQSGAENTHFVNAHGLPDANHYTTAYDMAKIMMEAIKTPNFPEIFSELRYEIPPTNKQPETRYLYNRNSLLNGNYKYTEFIAGKGGWTSQANHTLTTAAKQEDRELIAVVMNNQSKKNNYEDTTKLLDYGFQDFLDVTFDITDLEITIPELEFYTLAEKELVRLLHKNLSLNDVEASYAFLQSNDDDIGQLVISLTLNQSQNFMYKDLGSMFIEAETINEDLNEDIEDIMVANITANTDSKNIKNYLLAAFLVICIYIMLVFVKRRIAIKRNTLKLYEKYRIKIGD